MLSNILNPIKEIVDMILYGRLNYSPILRWANGYSRMLHKFSKGNQPMSTLTAILPGPSDPSFSMSLNILCAY